MRRASIAIEELGKGGRGRVLAFGVVLEGFVGDIHGVGAVEFNGTA